MTGSAPKLNVMCSSPEGLARLGRAAAALLGRLPAEVAARVVRSCVVFALDGERHAGFAQGLGSPRDVTQGLAAERVRQGAGAEDLTIIVLALDGHRQNLAWILAHEVGHVVRGHTALARGLAASLTDHELAALEREADDFANQYTDW